MRGWGLSVLFASVGGPFERRVNKTATGLYWVDDNFQPLTLTDASGNPQKDFIFFGGMRAAMVVTSTGNPYYYLSDRVGSTSVVSSGDGKAISWDADYYPYGGTRIVTSSINNTFRFTGYENDSETGNNYAVFRYQSSILGRFFSPDPVPGSISDPQSWNRYAYVTNNPTNAFDPLGLLKACVTVHDDFGNELVGCEWSVDANDRCGIAGCGQPQTGQPPTDQNRGHETGDRQGPPANNCPGCTKPNQTVRQCADDIANHWSIAGLLPGSPGLHNTFFGGFVNGLIGNNITNVTSIYGAIKGEVSPQSAYGTIVGAGSALGAVGSSAPAGAQGPVAAVVNNVAPKAFGEVLQAAILPKWILDSAIYGFAVSYCKTGKY